MAAVWVEVPAWVAAAGCGQVETLDEYGAREHEAHVAALLAAGVGAAAEEGAPDGPAVAEGRPEEAGGSPALTHAQRKLLEEHYERNSGGVRFQELWHRVRKLPGAPTSAQTKQWVKDAPDQVYFPQHGCCFLVSEAPKSDGAPAKPTVRKRNGKLVFDSPHRHACPEPEPEPDPKPEPEPICSLELVDKAPSGPATGRSSLDDGGLFGDDDEQEPSLDPSSQTDEATPPLFSETRVDDSSPQLFETPVLAQQPPPRKSTKLHASRSDQPAELSPPPAPSLEIDQVQKIAGKAHYHVVWQGHDGHEVDVWRRYSAFDALRAALLAKLGPAFAALPFPRKKMGRGNSAKITAQRQQMLAAFLSAVLLSDTAEAPPMVVPERDKPQGHPCKLLYDFLYCTEPQQ